MIGWRHMDIERRQELERALRRIDRDAERVYKRMDRYYEVHPDDPGARHWQETRRLSMLERQAG